MPITAMLTMLETVTILVPIIVLVDTTTPVEDITMPVVDISINVTEEYTTTLVVEITQSLLLSVTVKLVIHNMLDLFNLYQIL
jgi:hypothetical protein